MKAKELRDLSSDELNHRMRERTEFLMSFRVQVSTGVVDNVRAARVARRDIARIKTILRDRALEATRGANQA